MTRTWLTGVPLGSRVVVRYLIEDGERATDALGTLTGRTPGHLEVTTRRGPVLIQTRYVVAAKVVPPPPQRRRQHEPPGR